MPGSRCTVTSSWKGILLQDLPTSVLAALAAGDVGRDSKQRRLNAIAIYEKRKTRTKRIYVDSCEKLQRIYSQLFRHLNQQEAQHLALVFSLNELRVINGFLKGKNCLKDSVSLMKDLGLSIDGTAYWDCIDLIDAFQLEVKRLWPSYIGRCENKFGIRPLSDIPLATIDQLAARRAKAGNKVGFIRIHKSKEIPLPTVEDNKPACATSQETEIPERQPRKIPTPADWFVRDTKDLSAETQTMFWQCVLAMNESGWFSTSQVSITAEAILELKSKRHITSMTHGWFRVNSCSSYLPKLGKHYRAIGGGTQERESHQERISHSREQTKGSPIIMNREDLMADPDRYPPIPEHLQAYFMQLMRGATKIGVVNKGTSGYQKDDPELLELKRLNVVDFAKSSGQLRFVSPYSMVAKAFADDRLSENDIRVVCFESARLDVLQPSATTDAGFETEEPTKTPAEASTTMGDATQETSAFSDVGVKEAPAEPEPKEAESSSETEPEAAIAEEPGSSKDTTSGQNEKATEGLVLIPAHLGDFLLECLSCTNKNEEVNRKKLKVKKDDPRLLELKQIGVLTFSEYNKMWRFAGPMRSYSKGFRIDPQQYSVEDIRRFIKEGFPATPQRIYDQKSRERSKAIYNQQVQEALEKILPDQRPFLFKILTHTNENGSIKRKPLRLAVDAPELAELGEQGILYLSVGHDEWMVKPPLRMLAVRHARGEVTSDEILDLLGLRESYQPTSEGLEEASKATTPEQPEEPKLESGALFVGGQPPVTEPLVLPEPRLKYSLVKDEYGDVIGEVSPEVAQYLIGQPSESFDFVFNKDGVRVETDQFIIIIEPGLS